MNLLERIRERIAGKQDDYIRYNFSAVENDMLKTFFDLSQEFEDLDEFAELCIGIPSVFLGLQARFYLMHERLDRLALVAQTEPAAELLSPPPEEVFGCGESPIHRDSRLLLGIHGKSVLMDQLPFNARSGLIAALEIYPVAAEDEHRIFYLRKFANRIGYNLHNRFLALKNAQHLKFIRTLVADIEHNIIVPNMIFRLYLRQLLARVHQCESLEEKLREIITEGTLSVSGLQEALDTMHETNRGLAAEYEHIDRHYTDMSLFLETLLRRSHFDQGRLIPRTKLCNIKKEVVGPQLERFRERLASHGITINDEFSGIPDEEMIGVVDVGLLSQAYANLFSNALKYTEAIVTESGEKKKYVSYGREVITNFFGDGRDGVKYNVFSTGSHIRQEDRLRLFEDGGRAENALDRPGTGHGLFFVRNVVEIHGGVVGYEPTPHGNNFYFILPKESS